MDSMGEGEGGKIWENGIETCIISCMKRDASPGSMHNTGCFSFSISSSSEYSGLISFRMDWFDLLAVQGTLKSLFQQHNLKVSNSLALSLHSFDYMDLCQHSDVFVFYFLFF